MEHASDAVRRLAGKRRRSVGLAVELRAPLEQLDDVLRALADEHVDGIGVAEPGTGHVDLRPSMHGLESFSATP